jgi:hypothetical protein
MLEARGKSIEANLLEKNRDCVIKRGNVRHAEITKKSRVVRRAMNPAVKKKVRKDHVERQPS